MEQLSSKLKLVLWQCLFCIISALNYCARRTSCYFGYNLTLLLKRKDNNISLKNRSGHIKEGNRPEVMICVSELFEVMMFLRIWCLSFRPPFLSQSPKKCNFFLFAAESKDRAWLFHFHNLRAETYWFSDWKQENKDFVGQVFRVLTISLVWHGPSLNIFFVTS